MRPSIHAHALYYCYCFSNRNILRIEVVTKETNSSYSNNINAQFSHIICTERSYSFLTSAAMKGIPMRGMSKLS
jgi:hypothetical protein